MFDYNKKEMACTGVKIENCFVSKIARTEEKKKLKSSIRGGWNT